MATDGVIAINKPPNKTSAQVLRNLQHIFKQSELFAEHLQAEQEHNEHKDKIQSFTRQNRKRRGNNVKIGHGGTLDPMATGVLIAGIGRGTKQLSKYLDCTKEYEAIAIFGANTDTYDREGKITTRKPYGHITREAIEGVLDGFRGDILQKPPMFSALSLHGKRLYEYAREGIPIPVEIQKRPCTISNLEIIKFEPGSEGHEWEYPNTEATEVEKKAAEAYEKMGSGAEKGEINLDPSSVDEATYVAGEKRKAEEGGKRKKRKKEKYNANTLNNKKIDDEGENGAKEDEGEDAKEDVPPPPPPPPVYHEDIKPPVVHFKMTVSRGTYVRSLIHDIAEAAGSAAFLVGLTRTRQGEYELGNNVIEWGDFEDGAWEKKVQAELEKQKEF